MSNLKTLNCQCTMYVPPVVYGMIDGNASHSSRVTWMPPVMYVRPSGETKTLQEISRQGYSPFYLGKPTAEMGDDLACVNKETFNAECNMALLKARSDKHRFLNGRSEKSITDKAELDELKAHDDNICNLENAVPSLIIASTADMEFAHLKGYDGEELTCDVSVAYDAWDTQVKDTAAAALKNPLRLFPLFSYDPRRYRLPNDSAPGGSGCKQWDDPFAYIAGSDKSSSGISKIWLGFRMDPALGFRPFDEFCEHLPEFYKKCEEENIPILSRCAPEGIAAMDAKRYVGYKQSERKEKYEERAEKFGLKDTAPPLITTMYHGREKIVEDANLNYFYRNYGHPRNWIPVLKYCPKLRLCLSGFGGNAAWGGIASLEWSDREPIGREWISAIIKLTRYPNVYADISGLDIGDAAIYETVQDMIGFIHEGDEDYAHLKYKLIFGTDWYLTHQMELGGDGNYKEYCERYRELFDEVDTTGKLWERVSLVNPWNFYALDKKIKDIHDALEGASGVSKDALKLMWKVIDGDADIGAGIGGEGLKKYITKINDGDPWKDIDVEKEWIGDLAAGAEEVLEEMDPIQIVDIYWSYGDKHIELRDKFGSDACNVWETKRYSDLNVHVITRDGNDGKVVDIIVTDDDGEEYDLCGIVSDSQVVFENVCKNNKK